MRQNRGLQKITMYIDPDDYARLGELYPANGKQAAIREIVRAHLQQIDAGKKEKEIFFDV